MIVATGGGGMLGRALARAGVHVLPRAELDITREADIARILDELRPEIVINAAAYTAVDRAETERDRAFEVNARGAGLVARACAARGIAVVHVSTDYVFEGHAIAPIDEDAPIAPRSVYGASKAAGEIEVLEAGGRVVRTAWVFGPGGPSFAHAIARVQTRAEVTDPTSGSPTYVDDLARALIAIAHHPAAPRIVHYAGEPATSRVELARAIVARLGRAVAIVPVERVDPIRPAYSVLAMSRARALGLVPGDWQRGLDALAEELRCASS